MLTFEERDMVGIYDDDDGFGLPLCEEAMFFHAGEEDGIVNEILDEVRGKGYVLNYLN